MEYRNKQFDKESVYTLEIHTEPASALFAYGYRIDGCWIRDAKNPLTMFVDANIEAQWRPEAEQMIQELESLKPYGYDRAALGRGGGPFLAGWANKRMKRWVDHTKDLYEADWYWTMDWWYEEGIPIMYQLLEEYQTKSLSNLSYMNSDPELVVGNKRPDTGTGWVSPLNTRQDFGLNLDRNFDMVENVINQYYEDMKYFFDPETQETARELMPDQPPLWPHIGGYIEVESGFRGIMKGSRSDADITMWDDLTRMSLEVNVREVGTDPSSVAHNKTVNSRAWEMDTWARFGSGITELPINAEAWKRVFLAPPLSSSMAEAETHDIYLLSADMGYTDEKINAHDKWTVERKETVKFGADNIWLCGIFLKMRGGNTAAHLISGSPFTMKSYCIQHRGIEAICKAQDLTSVRILGIGDDLQITGKKDHLATLLDYLGPLMRTKGMRGNIDFITGTYRCWISDDELVTWTHPRAVKSIPSPKDATDTPILHHGEVSDWITVKEEAIEQCDAFWQDYGDKILFRGSVYEHAQLIDSSYMEMRKAMARLGGSSEWLEEVPILGD
jgi:hypothetical protein